MKLSIIIVTYFSERTITACLDAISSQDAEVIVVDNASTDATLEIVKRYPVQLIASADNLGFNGGNALGVTVATGDIIVFLNPDAIAEPQYVEHLRSSFENHPQAGIIGSRLNDDDGRVAMIGTRFPSLGSLLHEHTRFRAATQARFDDFRYADWDRLTERNVDAVCGASMAIRTELLEKLGGLDTNYFLYFEEYDICQRVKRAGYDVVYDPSVTAMHSVGNSTGQLPSKHIENIYFTSRDRYLRKFYSRGFIFGFNATLFVSRSTDRLMALANRILRLQRRTTRSMTQRFRPNNDGTT